MTIDWQAFTPWPALTGGLLIGLAAALFVLLNGRVAGVSSILGGLSRLSPRSIVATLAFMGAGFATVFVLRHVLA